MSRKPRKPRPEAQTTVRDRVKELRRVRSGDLVPHPRNWRTHPEKQRAAVSGVLAEIGYASALIARELPDGRLQLIDGHLRADLDPEQIVPVVVLDVSEAEADKLLLTLDPLAELAEADAANLESLLRECNTGDQALADMLTDLAQDNGIVLSDADLWGEGGGGGDGPAPDEAVPEKYQLVVELADEAGQKELYESLAGEGYNVRVLTI